MATRKTQQAAPQRIAVSTPAQALALFQEFKKLSGVNPIMIPGSRAKYYSVQQMVEWFATQGKIVHGGWLGRALHAAVASGMKISLNKTEIDNQEITLYRASV